MSMPELHETEIGREYMKSVIKISQLLPDIVEALQKLLPSIERAKVDESQQSEWKGSR
jgi:hypothetical protein